MGEVLLADDTTLNRQVAIKLPVFAEHNRDELLARFQREAQAAARLHHTNIVPVFGTGRAEVCLACAKRLGENERSSVHRNRDDDDPYWYSHSYYPGYYLYGPGHWGSAFGSHDASHDRNDFTEADGSALRADGDDAFEHDASGS